ncbi:MAG TPA: sigma-E factor negative regulatory protein [Rhodanobacteraceae bacterium]|jgi:sigma-E factor negative regulatory protein RseA|nr:sigma-E factor negative regulatory protein [Rhodanobacteraceae bacterium]
MSQPIDEHLSAFMDGELGSDETRFLLRRLESDAQLAERWSRHHVARQVLRRQEVVALRGDFALAVMEQIEAEAAPQVARGGHWLRWGSGGAIAAAVAVAALIVTKPASGPEQAQIAAANPQRAPQAVTTDPAPKLAAAGPALRAPLVPNSPIQTAAASFGTELTEPVAFDPRLQSYVIRHYEATGSAGQSDFVPYILLPVQTPAPLQAENR